MPMPKGSMKLDVLERLNQARTRGNWLSYSDEGPIRYPAPNGKGWAHSICIGDERFRDEPHTCIGTVLAKDEPQARADADAVAAAVNALGPLLRIARAARVWTQTDDVDRTEWDRIEQELLAAVEAIEP
jgi:hypothetical protein